MGLNVTIVIDLCFSAIPNDSLLLGRYCDFMGDLVLVNIIIVLGTWLIGLSMFFRPHQVHMEGWSPWVGWEGESSCYNEKSSKGVCFLFLALLLKDSNRLLLQYCLISRLLHDKNIKDIKLLNVSPTPQLPSNPTIVPERIDVKWPVDTAPMLTLSIIYHLNIAQVSWGNNVCQQCSQIDHNVS